MSHVAFVFPGQGAQAVGMGRDLAETGAPGRRVFDTACEALGIRLDELCFEGPLEDLSRSDVAQPAILTTSIAVLRTLEQSVAQLPAPAGVAGLSLGEYTALVAAGALEFADAVRLVRDRGTFMQEACDASPGTMYAVIGLEDAQVEEACARARRETNGGVWPANYNSPGQLAISGEHAPAARAAGICKEMGARRALQLQVAGAFHTPLMSSAAEKLKPVLQDTQIRKPRCPVIANVNAKPVEDPEQIREMLLKQVTHPVRWTACVQAMSEMGVETFYEIGPGKVIAGLLRRIDRNLACKSVGTSEDIAALHADDTTQGTP